MLSHVRLDIIIVGGGPAGLAAAAALALDGHVVTVLERHPNLQTRGGNIIVQQPAVQCLSHIGITDALDRASVSIFEHSMWSYKLDKPFTKTRHVAQMTDRKWTERPALQRINYEAAIAAGATVLFGKRAVVLREQDGRPTVFTADGAEYPADLIVGADGIKSDIRRLLFAKEDVRAVITSECIFQTEVQLSDIENDPVAAPFATVAQHLVFGPGRCCIGRPTAHGTMRMLFCDVNYGQLDAGEDAVDETWNSNGDPHELAELFKDFNAPLRSYLSFVSSGGYPIDKWRIAVAPRMKTWLGLGGRCLIMGDAAHAMVPHNAQGASQGIEDALSLSTALRWAKTHDDIPWLLHCWETSRKARAEKMFDVSNENIATFSLQDGPEQEARDEHIRTKGLFWKVADWDAIEADAEAPHMTPQFSKWMLAYDVVAETNNYISERNHHRV